MGKGGGFIKAVTSETIAMHELMKEHLFEEGGGLWRYRDGWSDDRVAKEAGEAVGTDHSRKLSGRHAAGVRLEMFGPLVNANPSASVSRAAHADHEMRITRLENQLRRLLDSLGTSAQERATILGRDDG